MAKKTSNKRVPKTTVCSFCLEEFTSDQIWWVDMIMHRADPNCTSRYSTASCGECKDDPKNSKMIVGIHEEPKPKKKSKNEKTK